MKNTGKQKFEIEFGVNYDEYKCNIIIEANNVTLINDDTIVADGIKITLVNVENVRLISNTKS